MEPDAAELRVLGCLLEKQRTTPDAYPLTLNALRAACNQSTNRDPVVAYDEATIRDAAHRLWRRGWARLASGAGSRAPKYRHLLDEALGLPPDQLAVLCVLLLRGPQTPGELRQRAERLHAFPDPGALEAALAGLDGRGLAEALPRRPGHKEVRWRQLLGGPEGADTGAPAPPGPAARSSPEPRAPAGDGLGAGDGVGAGHALAARVERLERDVADLRERLGRLAGDRESG